MEKISEQLLVDNVVENYEVSLPGKKKVAKKKGDKGWVVDVWPKPGVTDSVGETVQKGLRDLGYIQPVLASSAIRYSFPKASKLSIIEKLVKGNLANNLIHDINIRKAI